MATYDVIADPPLFVGAENASCAVFEPVALTFVITGALGVVGASAGVVAAEEGDTPSLLIATIENV